MRICPKCSKQVSDDSKICRDCGAILEEVTDEEVPAMGVEWEPASQTGSPPEAEPQEAGVATADQPIIGEVVVGSEEPSPPDTEASAWKCPQCGETVPGTFDVCWKCLTTKDGEKAEQDSEFLQQIAEGTEPDEKPESTELYAEALGIEKDVGERPESVCPRCGSAKIMHGVTVSDQQGEYSDGRLRVVVFGDPSALIFKDRLYGELTADICGDCGHVELRVANPAELYRHYLNARK